MSKNAMSFYLRQLIIDSGAVSSARPPRAHDIRGIATSLNYYSNLSLTSLMQVATWKSKCVQPYTGSYMEVETCFRFSLP